MGVGETRASDHVARKSYPLTLQTRRMPHGAGDRAWAIVSELDLNPPVLEMGNPRLPLGLGPARDTRINKLTQIDKWQSQDWSSASLLFMVCLFHSSSSPSCLPSLYPEGNWLRDPEDVWRAKGPSEWCAGCRDLVELLVLRFVLFQEDYKNQTKQTLEAPDEPLSLNPTGRQFKKKRASIDFRIRLHKLQVWFFYFYQGTSWNSLPNQGNNFLSSSFMFSYFRNIHCLSLYVSPMDFYKSIFLSLCQFLMIFLSFYLQQSHPFKFIKFSLKCIIVMSQILNSDFVSRRTSLQEKHYKLRKLTVSTQFLPPASDTGNLHTVGSK